MKTNRILDEARLITKADVLAWTKANQSRVVAAWTKANPLGKVILESRYRGPNPRAVLPDLVYAGPGCPNSGLSPDGQALFLIPVKNQGMADAGPSITRLQITGVGMIDQPTPAIKAGATVTVPFMFNIAIAATGYRYVITVNMFNLVTESDYQNNIVQNSCIG